MMLLTFLTFASLIGNLALGIMLYLSMTETRRCRQELVQTRAALIAELHWLAAPPEPHRRWYHRTIGGAIREYEREAA